jgi:hypothetical protein
MFTMFATSARMTFSTAAAAAIVAFGALTLDQAHIASAPRGTVEVGELKLIDNAPVASVTLPEVTVVAKKESSQRYLAIRAELPEVVVVAKRLGYMVANAHAATEGNR